MPVLHVDGGERQFADQAASLRRAFETLREGFAGAECLMCRLFLSDAAAQQRAAAAILRRRAAVDDTAAAA